jgi:cyclopropane fatty-acyl-phospholipid synthase-like methyltransferase
MGYLWSRRLRTPFFTTAAVGKRYSRLKGNERALDIGCRDGKVMAELAALLSEGSVLGIDNSNAMISFAHRRFPPAFFPNLQFR